MKAVLLAGGYGTRLAPITMRIPKVMIPIAGKPSIQHLIEQLREAGIVEIILSVNTTQKKIEEYFGNGSTFGVKISYIYEHTKSDAEKPGAVGAINNIIQESSKKGAEKDDYIIIGADNFVWGLNLKKFIEFYGEKKAEAAIALYDLPNRSDVEHFGVVQLDEHERIIRVQEKPKIEETISKLASTAIYLMSEKLAFEKLPDYVKTQKEQNKKPDRIGDMWINFVETNSQVYGFKFSGFWGDVGSAQTYIETNKFAMNLIKTKQNGKTMQRIISETAQIDKDAKIKDPVIIEDGVKIEKWAVIGPYTHIMKNSTVHEGARVSNSIVFENAVIEKKAEVEEAIIDCRAHVKEEAKIESYSIIGFASKAGKKTRVMPRSKLMPFIELNDNTILEGEAKLSINCDKIEDELKRN